MIRKEIEIKLKLKNAEGKRMLEVTKLEYSKAIIRELKKNPDYIEVIIDYLKIPEETIISHLSGDTKANISFYDQALEIVKSKR